MGDVNKALYEVCGDNTIKVLNYVFGTESLLDADAKRIIAVRKAMGEPDNIKDVFKKEMEMIVEQG
jgi:hypothetical protein